MYLILFFQLVILSFHVNASHSVNSSSISSNVSLDSLFSSSKDSQIIFLERDGSTGQRKINGNLMCNIYLRTKPRSTAIMSRPPFADLPAWSASIDYCYRYGDAKVVETVLAKSSGQPVRIQLVDRKTLLHLMDVCDQVTLDKMSILSLHSPPSSNSSQEPVETDTLMEALGPDASSPVVFLERDGNTTNSRKIGQPIVLTFLRNNSTKVNYEQDLSIPMWAQSLDYCQGLKYEEDIVFYLKGNTNVSRILVNQATISELKRVCFQVTLQHKGLSGLIASG